MLLGIGPEPLTRSIEFVFGSRTSLSISGKRSTAKQILKKTETKK
jgi:hypothetical protein